MIITSITVSLLKADDDVQEIAETRFILSPCSSSGGDKSVIITVITYLYFANLKNIKMTICDIR